MEIDKTKRWFEQNKERIDRYDAVIEYKGVPVGLIGFLSIYRHHGKAELYISMGEEKYKGKGIAKQATGEILAYVFFELNLNRIYLYMETGNIRARRLFEGVGFRQEGIVRQDLFSKERFVDRVMYAMLKSEYKIQRGDLAGSFSKIPLLRVKELTILNLVA